MENKIITIRNVYGKVKEVHFQPCRQENGTPWPFVKPVRYDSNGNSELILSDKERNDPNNKYFDYYRAFVFAVQGNCVQELNTAAIAKEKQKD